MKKNKYFLLVVLTISIFSLSLILSCVPDLADIDQPIVQLIHPANGEVVSGIIPVVASATDDKTVDEIRIFIDGKVEFTTKGSYANYSWNTTPIADNQDHYVSAIAIDNSDNIGYSQITSVRVVGGFDSDTLAPTVTILNPTNNQVVRGSINIVAEISDPSQISTAEFYIDGRLIEVVGEEPYEYLWDTSTLINGSFHTIFVRARTVYGNTSVSQVLTVTINSDVLDDSFTPTITILNPINGQVVRGSVNINADVSGPALISIVEFYIDGNLTETLNEGPYEYLWDTSALLNGSIHSIFIRAQTVYGNSSVSPVVAVTIDSDVLIEPEPIPLTVTILNPINGQVVTGSINIVADVSDPNQVSTVEFYIDGIIITTLSEEPYEYLWNTSILVNGSVHTIFIRAHSIDGITVTSQPLVVTIDSDVFDDITPPTLTILYPTSGLIFSADTTMNVNVVADAQDAGGINKVEFYIDGILKQTDSQGTIYEYNWPLAGYGDGLLHSIYVKAFDNSLNSSAALILVTITP